jgi:hypothetical protein
MVALSLAEPVDFRSRGLAPIRSIRGSSEVDASRSSIQVPLKSGLSDVSAAGKFFFERTYPGGLGRENFLKDKGPAGPCTFRIITYL